MCAYFHSLHFSGSHVPIIRIISVSVRHLVYVTVQMTVWYTHQTVIILKFFCVIDGSRW
jgi:hypothetical protein